VGDRRVLSGITFTIRNRPPKTLYNWWKRLSDIGVFAKIVNGLAAEGTNHKAIMIATTYLKALRTVSNLRLKKGSAAGHGSIIEGY
jgi:hypothetical protein